jgi:uncharacterized protein (DUF2267 family)
MEEIIDKVAAAAGIDRATARRATAVVLDLIVREAPADKTRKLFAALPGANDLAREGAGGGGLFGALGGNMGAAYAKLKDAGLDTDQMRGAGKTLLAEARAVAGDEKVDEIVKSIPGLSKLV